LVINTESRRGSNQKNALGREGSRYEIKGVQPPANTLKKLADVFDTTIDCMISGDKDEKVKASLKDAELLQQFKSVE
jgi:transcriptional regulator with XRE-family HTH domain